MIIALYFAYLEAISPNRLDMFVPRARNITTQPENGTKKITTIVPERIHPPFIPRFVILWGFIGAATYVLKVTTGYMSRGTFKDEHIPDHIVRLFVGTALAITVYFVLSTGGFFGLTIDIARLPNPNLVQYVYAVIAFFSGYSSRHIIDVLSSIVNSLFAWDIKDKEKRKEEEKRKEA